MNGRNLLVFMIAKYREAKREEERKREEESAPAQSHSVKTGF